MKKTTEIEFLVNGEKQKIHYGRLGSTIRAQVNTRIQQELRSNPSATSVEVEIGDLLQPTNKFVFELTDAESELLRQAVSFVLGAAQLDANEKETLAGVAERLKNNENRLSNYPVGNLS